MKYLTWAPLVLLFLFAAQATAADYQVQPLAEAAPEEGVAAEIRQQLAPTGFRINRGSRTLCDIWLCQEWPTKPDFQASGTILYPFEIGRLFGLIRFHRDAEDFRGQEIVEGVYTLRYAQQPVDGNHIGTSDTLDFLLMLPLDEDTSVEPIDEDTLFAISAAAAGTTHPAMLSMLRVGDDEAKPPTMMHDEARDFWSVRLTGQAAGDGQDKPVVVEFVVIGVSEV